MMCHECAMVRGLTPAVALCRFCLVGLCKPHLVDLYGRARSVPQYACHHRPGARPAGPLDGKQSAEPAGAVIQENAIIH